jgi:hypothetical protein
VADRNDSDREVLTSLPRSRPVRRSTKRAARPDGANVAKATPTATSKAARPAAKPRAKAAPKTAAGATTKPAAKATPKPRPKAAAGGPATARRKVPPAGYASPAEDDRVAASADLIGTAVQAAGELAQIGFAVGRQALQSMFERLPKP